MQMFTPAQVTDNYTAAAKAKTEKKGALVFILAVFGGMVIALGAATSNTAIHSIENISAARIIAGAMFAFGLPVIVLTGAELFTGNSLLAIPLIRKNISAAAMLKNWGIVYLGNFLGAAFVAACCAFSGQFNFSGGGLAVFTIQTAAAKCALPFGRAVILGFFCNVLVCAGVFCALTAQSTGGRVIGAYLPVFLFVCCGFEHSVANMYYIPAGLFAMQNGQYAVLASAAGVNTAALGWPAFLGANLLPVTIGNILGGVFFALVMHFGHGTTAQKNN